MTHNKPHTTTTVLGVPVDAVTKDDVLKRVTSFLAHNKKKPTPFVITSINPEMCVRAHHDTKFKELLASSDIRLIDGIGILHAARLKDRTVKHRLTGADLMPYLVHCAAQHNWPVLFVGGRGDVAGAIAKHYNKKYKKRFCSGLEGVNDIQNGETKKERKQIEATIQHVKPKMVFVAFGAPYQERWIEAHREILKRTVCMVVGGTLDYITGRIPRAPRAMQMLGLEWLFRLGKEPWRWRRQLRLVEFVYLVLWERVRGNS